MTKYIKTIILLFLFSCANDKPRTAYIEPKPKEINDIIISIISEENFPIAKRNFQLDTSDVEDEEVFLPAKVPLCVDLRKSRIIFPTKKKGEAPPPSPLFTYI